MNLRSGLMSLMQSRSSKSGALLALVCCMLVCVSCDAPEPDELTFVGSSIVARWDLSASFPSLVTRNEGETGSGVSYLETWQNRLTGKDVVICSGTNDLVGIPFDSDRIDRYAARYLAAVMAMDARRVYLFSVLPRNYPSDPADCNRVISAFNERIRNLVADIPCVVYLDVYDAFLYRGTINPNLTLDGLHPNVYGYQIMAHALKDSRSPLVQ